MQNVDKIYDQCREEALRDYFTFLKFKSVSSEKEHVHDVKACADWLVTYLKNMGFKVELWEIEGHHPTIFASFEVSKSKPTLLIYNHYDVQPIDPLEAWNSPPFEPTERDGEIYARGAQDNKGQCFYTVQALKALLKHEGTLPVNVKLCIEGEEECGSIGLAKILKEKSKELKADFLAIVDVGIPAKNQPAVTLGARGLVTMDVEVQGTNVDLHSGSHGGLVYNPIHALVEILNSVRLPNGKVAIPSFYDDVLPLTSEEKKELSFTFDENEYEKKFGCKVTGGEKEFSPLERISVRPTFEVNGISGGYSGLGFKTVIPSIASAKISCRLVPNQEPKKIAELVKQYLEKKAPPGVKVSVHIHQGGGKAVRAKLDSKVSQAFVKAYQAIFNTPCKFIFEGGSIPIVTELSKASESEVVFVGLGLSGDQIHAPNEHFGLDRFEKGFKLIIHALHELGK